jgi:DNA-damage-inducible protein D
MNEEKKSTINVLEQIKHVEDKDMECWFARKLTKIQEYSGYSHFNPVNEKAKECCKNSGPETNVHFEEFPEMVKIGGTMPEELPVTDSIKKIEKTKEPKQLKTLKGKNK